MDSWQGLVALFRYNFWLTLIRLLCERQRLQSEQELVTVTSFWCYQEVFSSHKPTESQFVAFHVLAHIWVKNIFIELRAEYFSIQMARRVLEDFENYVRTAGNVKQPSLLLFFKHCWWNVFVGNFVTLMYVYTWKTQTGTRSDHSLMAQAVSFRKRVGNTEGHNLKIKFKLF